MKNFLTSAVLATMVLGGLYVLYQDGSSSVSMRACHDIDRAEYLIPKSKDVIHCGVVNVTRLPKRKQFTQGYRAIAKINFNERHGRTVYAEFFKKNEPCIWFTCYKMTYVQFVKE